MSPQQQVNSKFSRRHQARLLLIAVVCTVVMLVADFWPAVTILDKMELRTVDWRFRYRGQREHNSDIVLAAIDEASIQKVGRWPWPRRVFADLTDRLNAAGARAIVYDVFFVDREVGSQGDEAFVRAVNEAGNVYLAGYGTAPAREEHLSGEGGSGQPAVGSRHLGEYAWSQARVVPGSGLNALAGLYQLPNLTYPFAEMAAQARGIGYTDLTSPPDGIFRHVPLLGRHSGALYPSLPLVVGADMLQVRPEQVTVHLGQSINLGDRCHIPLDLGGRTVINYLGANNTYKRLPVWKMIESAGSRLSLDLQSKIVIVAVTAPGLHDLRSTSFDELVPGGEVQAAILDNILSQQFLVHPPPQRMMLIVLFIGIAIGLIFALLPTAHALVGTMGLLVAYNWLGVWAFTERGLILDLFVPSLTGVIVILALVSYRLLREESQRSRARETLGHFVPAQIVSQLMEEEAAETLQGQRRIVSVLFCDLRGFTAASERLSPEATVALLNRYFALMHEVIWEFEGTLDKFIGDGLMAFFNAPVDQPDHARRAVQAAIEMQRRIEFNRAEWEFLGWGQLAAGIGISTGEAVVGYINSRERMQYTAIGAQVNLAARLEELTKEYDARILISDKTHKLLKDIVDTDHIGGLTVRGFAQPVDVFSVRVPLR